MTDTALTGLRVVEWGGTVAAAYGGKLLAGLGADVIKVEPPDGDPTRRRGPFARATSFAPHGGYPSPWHERSGLFLYCNTNKRGVTLDLTTATGRALLLQLLERVDIFLHGGRAAEMAALGLDFAPLHAINPRLIVTAVTPFGQDGPYAEYVSSELTAWNAGGFGSMTPAGAESHEVPPLKPYGRQVAFMSGASAAAATLTALFARAQTGEGQLVDVTEQETQVAALEPFLADAIQQGFVSSRSWPSVAVYDFIPCRDGYVSLLFSQPDQWDRMVAWMGNPEWARVEEYRTVRGFGRNWDVLSVLLGEFFVQFSKAEIVAEALARRLPLAPVLTIGEVLAAEQLRQRDFFVEIDHPATGPLRYPGAPFRLSASPWRFGRAPVLGEHNGVILGGELGLASDDLTRLYQSGIISHGGPNPPTPFPPREGGDGSRPPPPTSPAALGERSRTEPSPLVAPPSLGGNDERGGAGGSGEEEGVGGLGRTGAGSRLPLAGVRVIDFTWVWAGPFCTQILADMGAEVIKVETGRRPDSVRNGRNPQGELFGINRTPSFNTLNRNKLDITVDLAMPHGPALIKRLVAVSDVVINNYAPRVMPGLGLDYERLRQVRPDIITLAMSAFGADGPLRDAILYGNSQVAVAGLASVTGDPEGPPKNIGYAYGDPVNAVSGYFAVLAALWHRDHTGEGQAIDLSQAEGLLCTMPEALLHTLIHGTEPPRQSNGDEIAAPHNVYRCRDAGDWVAIAVENEAQWQGLVAALGNPAWTADERFADQNRRWLHQREIDAQLAGWVRERLSIEVMTALQRHGVPAAPSWDLGQLAANPHLHARGYFERSEHPETGTHLYPGAPFRLHGTPGGIRRHAPLFGEHTREVLTRVLGLDSGELRSLQESGTLN